MKTLGVVANLYQEANALPGWLESASQFADEIVAYHAGPDGKDSTDGTIEILEKWKIPIHRGPINEGFGIVRTAAVRACKTDYVMLLDCDERFLSFAPVLTCSGVSSTPEEVGAILNEYDAVCRHKAVPSNIENLSRLGAKLEVVCGEIYNQAAWLKDIIQHGDLDAVCTIRRHWHDFTLRRPTQNWHHIPDYQYRIVRNHPSIHWDANTRMHERLLGASNVYLPNQKHGPFLDHFHLAVKKMELEQRAFDVAVYDALHFGTEMPKP